MPPTILTDIIQAALETADCEKSNNFSATEKARIANESLSSTYDFVVATWQSYFATSKPFTLTGNEISLAELTTGFPDGPGTPVSSTALDLVSPTTSALQYFAVTTPALAPEIERYTISSLRIAPQSPNEGNDTTFTLYVNGEATDLQCVIVGGFATPITDTTHSVTVSVGDLIQVVASNEAVGEGSNWWFDASMANTALQPPSLFYKELGLTRVDSCRQPIPQLSGYSDRNTCDGPKFWIQGGYLSLWPQTNGTQHAGSYLLDYVPNCPVLELNDELPPELERWKELITVNAAIRFLLKRKQSTADLERRQKKLEDGIRVAATNRVTEVRKLRVDRSHDGARFGWSR